ncbi:hypothetical protein T440DRAFT_454413 [Plenodomus tracheiphilus IPT5]|uniref:Uncharacterized protein n=1 Tax=Plenodomus tracheiphilus IPT5 TaxID=1408161 RepID=A0A6A7B2D1_9PLEO|nr:hypothetical protein T440DRAFT_454413 [Plenodomus tracheiphilus IPT5]
MVDAQDSASKLFSKTSRWRTKIFDKTADDAPAPKPPKIQDPNDLDDFLKPSTDRAQQQKDALAAFSNRPRIDVARAQRWPGAQDILAGAAAVAKSPGPGGLKTGTRKKGLTVGFVRTVPDIIGHGGDECEDPAIIVSQQKQKQASAAADASRLQPQKPQDDTNLGVQTNGIGRTPSQTEQRNSLTRTLTNPGEMSPPLGQKMQMGHINSHAQPPPPPPQRMGPMGLGERPRGLARAPTGFDQLDLSPTEVRRPSVESAHSQDSENLSPVAQRMTPVLPPTLEEDENFRPKPISRTQTGFQSLADSAPAPAVPNMPPRLPEMHLVEQEGVSPIQGNAAMAERFLQSEPTEESSFSARVKQRMRSEEGRALQEAAQRAASGTKRDSDSSSSVSTDLFQAGSPQSTYVTPNTGRSPPQGAYFDPPRASPMRSLEADDPYRSRARGPSPGRRPMQPAPMTTDADARPASSASSQYSSPSVASQTRASPSVRSDPASAANVASPQRIPSNKEKPPFAAFAQGTAPSMPVRSEQRPPYFPPPQALQQQQSPPHQPPQLQHPQPLAHTQSQHVSAATHGSIPLRSRSEVTPQPAASLGRSDTKMQNDTAYRDFAERVTHMRGIFQLTAQLGGHMYNHSPSQWIRVATWWFLKGRAGMESLIRSQIQGDEPHHERLSQPHVDLAKVWWILNEVLPNHPGLQNYGGRGPEAGGQAARQAGDSASADTFEIQTAITHYMKLLVGSMRKHQSMPPTQALIQGQDQAIWENYPTFTPDAASVLTTRTHHADASQNGAPAYISLSQYIPLTDTKGEFCYFRMFVKASLATDDPSTDRVPMPAVISILRPKDQYQVKLAICSQTNLINIMVGHGSDVTWKDVNWNKQSRKISIQLRHGFALTLELSEGDMRSLWSIVDHTNRVETDLRERRDERFACKLYLREASYRDPANPSAFPPERVPGCKLMVFQKIERSSEGTGKRKLHRGYRMVLVTAQHYKQVSLVNNELGTRQEPMNFEYVTEPDQAPAIRFHFREESPDKRARICTIHLVFQEGKDRNHLFGTFTSMNVEVGEMAFAQVPLKAFHIESADQGEGFSQKGSRILETMQWQEAKVLNVDPDAAGLESAPTIKSESLRIVCRHTAGIISDRMNLGSGELLVRLPNDGAAELTLLREPQQDVAVAIDGSRTERDVPDALAELLRTLKTASTIRRLTFNSFKDLHTFQLAVTGFTVKFDGIALSFSISRRRMVVPIYKQWTANNIRIQIVQQDNIVQLLAFFEDFSHADAMNFQLRTMDIFEKSDKGGKFGLKLVDAKFALPVEERRGEGKMQKEEGRLTGWSGVKRRFVCLDEIEYPGEHDDILIQFDSAETRDRFAEALPAAAMERKFTVRRKI